MQSHLSMKWFAPVALCVALTACGGGSSSADAGLDGSARPDARVAMDAAHDALVPTDAARDAALPEADAGCPSADALVPLTDGLFFTSESDRAIEVGFEAGAGSVVESADVVRLRELVGATGSEVTSVVGSDRFFLSVVVDPTREPPVPESRPMDLERAFEAITTRQDWVGYEVTEADGVTVRVYLLGATRCGDAIWLESVAIRT